MIFLSFFAENSKNSPKILKIRRKFAENSENSPKILKIRRKFLKKKVFFEALISYRIVSYREKNPHIVSISYRIEKKLIATDWSEHNGNLIVIFEVLSNISRKPETKRWSFHAGFSAKKDNTNHILHQKTDLIATKTRQSKHCGFCIYIFDNSLDQSK